MKHSMGMIWDRDKGRESRDSLCLQYDTMKQVVKINNGGLKDQSYNINDFVSANKLNSHGMYEYACCPNLVEMLMKPKYQCSKVSVFLATSICLVLFFKKWYYISIRKRHNAKHKRNDHMTPVFFQILTIYFGVTQISIF